MILLFKTVSFTLVLNLPKKIFYLPSKYDKISVKVISTFNGDRKNPST